MKKFIVFILFALLNLTFASDPITIDSLFKKQIGLRSVTNLSFLTTGNPNTYNTYPYLSISGNPVIWSDTKRLGLEQSFIYTIVPKFDVITTFGGSYARREYQSFFTGEYFHDDRIDFDAWWIGFIYTGDSIGSLIPQISLQSAIIQKEEAADEQKNFYVKSQNLEVKFKGYSDPAIYSVFLGYGYNQKRKFNIAQIKYGDSVYFGGYLSIVLSPKITLDIGVKQGFQTEQKINGVKSTNLRSIPTINFGSTYSFDIDTALSFGASFGGGSQAPDSIFGISLWQKF